MDKVKITRDQLEAIKKFINYEFTLEDFVNSRGKFYDELKPVNRLNVDEMAKVLYTENYEVMVWDVKNVRHATEEEIEQEKERRWWERHGRDVWELVADDILIDENNYKSFIFKGVDKRGSFRVGNLILKFEEVKEHFKIACFTEDRKDIHD